jgi:hypothetical protein
MRIELDGTPRTAERVEVTAVFILETELVATPVIV